MKKIFSSIMILAVALAAVSCGGNASKADDSNVPTYQEAKDTNKKSIKISNKEFVSGTLSDYIEIVSDEVVLYQVNADEPRQVFVVEVELKLKEKLEELEGAKVSDLDLDYYSNPMINLLDASGLKLTRLDVGGATLLDPGHRSVSYLEFLLGEAGSTKKVAFSAELSSGKIEPLAEMFANAVSCSAYFSGKLPEIKEK